MLAAVSRISAQSMRRRFSVQTGFFRKGTTFYLNVDFTSHVALVADLEENRRTTIVGGGRYVVVQSVPPRSRSLSSMNSKAKVSALPYCGI